MPAPTIKAVYTSHSNDGGNAGAGVTTDTLPDTGDYLLICGAVNANGDTLTAPSGFTEATVSDNSIASTGGQIRAWYKKDPADSTQYLYGFSSSTRRTCIGLLIGGADGTTFIDVKESAQSGPGTNHTPPALTTTVADTLVVDFAALRQFAPDTSDWTVPASGLTWTEQADLQGSDSNNNVRLAAGTATKATAGAIGTAVWTNTDANEDSIIIRIAIKPAAGGSTLELAGDRSVAVAPTGAVVLSENVAGDRSVASTAVGALALDVALSGQRSVAVAPAGDTAADRPLAGDRSTALAPVGALALTATASAIFTVTVAASGAIELAGLVELAGTRAVSVAPVGTIDVPSAAINLGELVEDILNAVVSHAASLGHFDKVNQHEPKNAPGNGFTAAVWLQAIDPAPTVSSIVATSARLAWNIRLYQNFIAKPEDLIDIRMLRAACDLIQAYHEDFTLGGLVRNVDLLGEVGIPLSGKAGYLPMDNKLYRTIDVTVPLIVNDVWIQGG
jgi:hypothetical protein